MQTKYIIGLSILIFQEYIYLGFHCFDHEPEKIKASISRRDNPGNDDWIAFCLDSFNDENGCANVSGV